MAKGKPQEKHYPHWDVSRRGGINLEHILPKALRNTDQVLGEWVFRLGNTVLLQANKNAQIGSDNYVKIKSKELLKSEFVLTKEAGGKANWGPNEITDRQQRLAKLAVEVWPVRI